MHTLILAGGGGTRLWPLSRECYPKQFIRLFDDSSLFQKTVERALLFSEPNEIYVVTNEAQRFLVAEQLSEMGIEIPQENVLAEPVAKNTLPAIYFAVKTIIERRKSATLAVLPSDHLIEVNEEYKKAFRSAEELAKDRLVTFGIKPTRPHTGYGYIKPGKRINGGYEVDAFVEKPDIEKAREYVEKGYLWNSGMFVFDTRVFIEECSKYQHAVVEAFRSESLSEAYAKAPSLSIDYGVMERTRKAAVVPLSTSWSDVGNFDALYEIFEKDSEGNATRGECLLLDSRNNLIIGERLVAAVGMEDTILVDTGDVILLTPRRDAQRVKKLVEALKSRRDRRVEVPKTMCRPWGCFTVIDEGTNYKIKKLVVLPKRRLSLQRHFHRSEYWVVVKGEAKVRVGDKEFTLRRGETTFIPVREVHRIENASDETLEIIEVQLGDYLGEDDIERIEDDFGRVSKEKGS